MRINRKALIVVLTSILFSGAVLGLSLGIYYGIKNSKQNNTSQKVVQPIIAQVENAHTQAIYQRETPIIFELTPAPSLESILKLTVVSGTGWIFDSLSPTNSSGLLSNYYFLATNHHVINFLKSINSQTNPLPTSNLRFFVRMFFLKYQFSQNSQSQFNSSLLNQNSSAYDFQVTNNNVFASYNLLYFNGYSFSTLLPNSLNLPIGANQVFAQPLGGFGSAQTVKQGNFMFTTQNLTWTNIIDNLNITNAVGDADLGFVRLSFTPFATKKDVPAIINNFYNNYYLPKIDPFAINPVTLSNMKEQQFYIGGFPAIPNSGGYWSGITPGVGEYVWDTVRWISPANTGKFQNIFPEKIGDGIWNYGTNNGTNPFSYNGLNYLGAFTYTVPNLNLNHGSSGSMVTNKKGQIIGIYWGGLSNTNNTLFWGTIISFTLNNIPNIFNYYLKHYYVPQYLQNWNLPESQRVQYNNFLAQFYEPITNINSLVYGQTIINKPVVNNVNKNNIIINQNLKVIKKEDGE